MHQKMNIIDESHEMCPEECRLIHQVVEEVAHNHPNSIAIEDHSNEKNVRVWTYAEFNAAANALSQRILSASEGNLEHPVAILLESRVDILIASLAALKAGCAFVPLSTQYPVERIRHILSELNNGQTTPPLLITEDEKIVSEILDIPFQRIEFMSENEGEEDRNLDLLIPLSSLAYVVFTSGSTGAPKGVMVEHSALVTRLISFNQTFNITKEDRGSLLLNPAFDASFLESWALLFAGATILSLPEGTRKDPSAFKQFVKDRKVTRAVVPTSFAERLWRTHTKGEDLSPLKTLLVGGEQLTPVLSSWSELSYDVINGYGPTECVVQVSAYNVSKEEGHFEKTKPPLGFPMEGVQFKISSNEASENEDEGELWIGGNYLARGYWGNPSLTEKKFIIGEDGQRWYKTGDLVSFCPSSGYTFLRRVDDQVKVGGGFLVEPAEIEAVILDNLRESVDGVKIIHVNRSLIAFVSLKGNEDELTDEELTKKVKNCVASHLPSYMVPAFVLKTTSFPTTPHGKVDKIALEKIYTTWLERKDQGESETKGSGLEKRLTSLWSRVLQLPEKVISTAQDIFSVGADSLHMSEIGALIKKELGLEFSMDLISNISKNGSLDVKKMAGLLAKKEKVCPIVKLGSYTAEKDENGNDPPVLLFLHPDNGTLNCYKALRHRLGLEEYECYGIQDPDLMNFFNHSSTFESVQDMASYYVERIREKFPYRKVILAGYQFGGFLAWEMAAILGKEVVDAVFLFDSYLKEVDGWKEEERLVKEYEASRRNTKGVRAPLPVINAGIHKFRLGLKYQPTRVEDGPEVVVFGKPDIMEDCSVWPADFMENKEILHFYDVEANNDLLLEEPHAYVIANYMRKHLNQYC